ncbi:hypothetical protein [Mycobacteroides abscessus]|uniref:hypothetical protein n=1 Tax=Mycobacteroides abscessus TaxID=36809 RepID=UPI00374235ED
MGQVHWLGSAETEHRVLSARPTGRPLSSLTRSICGGEIDLWGRYRLRGSGRPPFPPAGLPHDRD